MSIKKEILKTIVELLLFLGIIIYGIIIFTETNKTKIFSISIVIFSVIIYLFSLKNDLEQIKNEYDNDINEHSKRFKKNVEQTQADLEKRGMTFSGEAVKKLGNKSVFTPETLGRSIPKGELMINKEDYEKYRNKKFKLDFKRAKYKVLINIFKK